MATLIPAVYKVTMPTQVAQILDFFSIAIDIDAWNVYPSCYGLGGLYYQIVFLMIWPLIAIAFTPVIGLVCVLILKQTTIRKMWAIGLRRGEEGFVDAVIFRFAIPLTMLVLFVAFPAVTALAFRAFEEPETFVDAFHGNQCAHAFSHATRLLIALQATLHNIATRCPCFSTSAADAECLTSCMGRSCGS